MLILSKSFKILFLIFKYRLFFLIGFIPGLGIFKVFLRKNSKKQAYRLKKLLEDIGPCFVKLGQVLSVRSDLIGETFAEALSTLREQGKKVSNKKMKPLIMKAFTGKISFSSEDFNKLKLIAVGSIAQVYYFKDSSNKEYAIKVLKPGIKNRFQEDLLFLKKIFGFAQRNIQQANRAKVLKVVNLLEELSGFELDFKFEIASASEVKEYFCNNPILYVPKIYWKLSSKNVLVTEWIDGPKIYNKNQLQKLNINVVNVLKDLITIFFLQVLKYGFVHGDMHPGNIIVKPNGAITMVDFGIMGRVSFKTRKYIYEVWKAFLNQDYKKAAHIHFEAGWVDSKKYNEDDMALAIRSIIVPLFLFNEEQVSIASLMEQLFEVTRIFGMEVQPDLLLIQKNMFLLEGIAKKLAPENNIWILAKDIINKEEFNLTIEERVSYFTDYIKTLVRKNICEAAYIFAEVYANRQQNVKGNTKVMLPRGISFIIILLLCIIILFLWKI